MPNDIFRPTYRDLTDQEKGQIDAIKTTAEKLYDLMSYWIAQPGYMLPPGRGLSLAKTKLEESVMWAVKGLTAPPSGNSVGIAPLGAMIGKSPGNTAAPANTENSAS